MRTRGATGKRVERKRSTPPAVEATRVSVRNAARKASKSIHQDSPAGRAENRERKKTTEKAVTVTTTKKRGKQVTTIATNTAPTPQPPVPAFAAAARKIPQAPAFSTPPPVSISTNTSVAEKKKENNRNKNYSPDEDLWLSKAYIYCTQDSVKGIDQTSTVFWSKIETQFDIHRNAKRVEGKGFGFPKRDANSLRNRWQKTILRKVNKFVAIYHSIESHPPSGTPENQWPDLAMKAYFRQEGHPFQFLQCWEYLKDKEKFKVPQEIVVEDASVGFDESVAGVSGLEFSSVSSKKKKGGAVNHVIAYKGSKRPMGRDMAKKLAKEELKMEREKGGSSASIQNAMKTMIDALARKQKEKEAHNKKKEMQAQREFQFNSLMKMVEFYQKMNNEEKANEFMMKAQALLFQNQEEVEGDKKPAAVIDGEKEQAVKGAEQQTDESVNSLLEYSQRMADEYEESQVEKECMAALKGGSSEDDDDDSFNTATGQVPATELHQGQMYNQSIADRRVGQQWVNWIPPIDEDDTPYFARGSPETVESHEDEDDSTTSHSSQPLLDDN